MGDKAICTQCCPYHGLNNGTCISCSAYCTSCDATRCLECSFGAILDVDTGKCVPCGSQNCKTCRADNPGVCTACVPGAKMNPVTKSCSYVPWFCNGWYFDATGEIQCRRCRPGTVKVGSSCKSCGNGCKKCKVSSEKGVVQCMECNGNFILNKKKKTCFSCEEGCLKCTSNGKTCLEVSFTTVQECKFSRKKGTD